MRASTPYREFTFGWLIFAFMVPTYGLMIYLFVTGLGDRPLTWVPFLLITCLIAIACVLFYGMTTELTSEALTVWFGIGLIRRKIPLTRIMSVESVKSPWYYGWGIRFIPNGMMYNISGFDTIELKFNDSDRVVRIGSKTPSVLKSEIEARLRRS